VYAIIEDSGTQIKVTPGDVLDIDLRDLEENADTVNFDRVLLLGHEDGKAQATVGMPYVDGASVSAELLGEVKGEKLTIFKYKRRKGSRHKTGHRQRYLRVKIKDISS
jgi:large subunit ribosomal protein L21